MPKTTIRIPVHPCACIHLQVCFNHEKNTMPGTESMHELMLSIFNIKLEANEELNGLNYK